MKREYKILVIGMIIIGLSDAVGSIASRKFDFNYSLLTPVAFMIYATIGFLATREKDLKTGVLIASAAGLFDSTVGWKISMLLGANTGSIKIDPTITIWVITIIFVTGLAALCGLIGGGLARVLKRKKL